jgi:hypothetical protein
LLVIVRKEIEKLELIAVLQSGSAALLHTQSRSIPSPKIIKYRIFVAKVLPFGYFAHFLPPRFHGLPDDGDALDKLFAVECIFPIWAVFQAVHQHFAFLRLLQFLSEFSALFENPFGEHCELSHTSLFHVLQQLQIGGRQNVTPKGNFEVRLQFVLLERTDQTPKLAV